jgi:toxin ParE1/3/4
MNFRFHPEAEHEYAGAIRYYLAINARLAENFIAEIEDGIGVIRRQPLVWRTVDADVRRYLIRRFPFGLYYTCEDNFVTIWAIMHLSRQPDYWKSRRV